MIRFISGIIAAIVLFSIIFSFTSCGLFFGDPSDETEYYINNQSNYNLRCEAFYISFSFESLKFDTIYIDSKSVVKILDLRGRSTPSEAFDTVRLYLSSNDTSNNKLLYELNVVSDDGWELIGHKSTRWGILDDWEMLIENSDLDLN